jgi:hypothetical protein
MSFLDDVGSWFRGGAPKDIRQYSPWADDYMNKYDLRMKPNSKRRYMMPYWDDKGQYIRYEVGDIVPMLETKRGIAWYTITHIHLPSPWYDGVPSDDGRKYDLVFYGHPRKRGTSGF